MLDVLYIQAVGYEGTGNAVNLFWLATALFISLGLFAALIALVYNSIFSGKGNHNHSLFQSLCWDIGLLFLITVGLRINETYLPAISEPISMIWNLVLLLATGAVVVLFRLLITRLGSFTGILIIIIWIMAVGAGAIVTISDSRSDNRSINKPNIILITLDTLRADHLGCYGYERDTSPNLDQFARDNHIFTSCRTPMPLTSPAHASLFSGKMPHEHGVFTNISRYPDDPALSTLAEELGKEHYRTIAFPAAVHMGVDFNFDRGFKTYNQSTVLSGPELLQSIYQLAPIAILSRLGIIKETWLARDSRGVNQAFFYWLEHNAKEENPPPFFAWLHYFDAHSPYQPPDEYWRRYDADYRGSVTGSQEECDLINSQLEETNHGEILPVGFSQDDIDNLIARYDGEIRHQDESLGDLFDELKKHGLWDNTIIVIVSDHGEGMYDDGYFGHNFTLKEYEIQVACVIKGPDIDCPKDRPLSLTDITDYIRRSSGIQGGGRLTGVDGGEEFSDDPYTSMVFLQSHCWIDPPYKLIRTWQGNGEGILYSLYNFADDPSENIDLFDISDERSTIMKDQLGEWLDKNNADFSLLIKKEGALSDIDPATLEMLRSLGYIY